MKSYANFAAWLLFIWASFVMIRQIAPQVDLPVSSAIQQWGILGVCVLCVLIKFARRWIFPLLCISAAIFLGPYLESPELQAVVRWGGGSIGAILLLLSALTREPGKTRAQQMSDADITSLINQLSRSAKLTRQEAARKLLDLYQHANLTESQKQLILAQRRSIENPHTDNLYLTSHQNHHTPPCTAMTYGKRHTDVKGGRQVHADRGIGIDFPL